MTDTKEVKLPHSKAAGFVSVGATGAALSRLSDGTFQLVFHTLVADLIEETITVQPDEEDPEKATVLSSDFETEAMREDRVRVTMPESAMRAVANLLANRFGLIEGKHEVEENE